MSHGKILQLQRVGEYWNRTDLPGRLYFDVSELAGRTLDPTTWKLLPGRTREREIRKIFKKQDDWIALGSRDVHIFWWTRVRGCEHRATSFPKNLLQDSIQLVGFIAHYHIQSCPLPLRIMCETKIKLRGYRTTLVFRIMKIDYSVCGSHGRIKFFKGNKLFFSPLSVTVLSCFFNRQLPVQLRTRCSSDMERFGKEMLWKSHCKLSFKTCVEKLSTETPKSFSYQFSLIFLARILLPLLRLLQPLSLFGTETPKDCQNYSQSSVIWQRTDKVFFVVFFVFNFL